MQNIKEKFKNPDAIYRSAPFWSWNDRLEITELERQVHEMAMEHLGGFFMHSRIGLLTPYMGKEWMDCVDACVKRAKKTGLKAWLYDEDRWPSGFAGGKVPGRVKEHTALEVTCRKLESGNELINEKDTIAVFKWNSKDASSAMNTIPFKEAKKCMGSLLVFEHAWCPDNPWFNDKPYPNLMHEGAVKAFIDSTYEPYYRRFGNEFGKTIPGIFTDEPQYPATVWGEIPRVPWRIDFDDIFKKRNGYSIIPHLPEIFFDMPGHEKPRYDFWRTASALFVENFSKQIGEWCGKHNIWLTGHYMCEDDLQGQIKYIGNAMAHYEHMQAPGVDHLCENIKLLETMKQAGSVANQLGKERVLSELYGTSGWNHSFEGQKWIGDWEYSLGVNLRCQHLALYTMKGCRKRDYPPVIFFQQHWWGDYDLVEDYYGRLSLVLSSGTYQPEVLVIHPVNSAYTLYLPDKSSNLAEMNSSLKKVSTWLCELHRMWDYGDEGIMSRHATTADGVIKVGAMTYRAVIIPPSRTICRSTFDLLKKFTDDGGTVITIGEQPAMIEAEPSAELKDFLSTSCRHVKLDKTEISKALDKFLGYGVSVRDSKGNEIADIYAHRRKVNGSDVLFLNNISREKSYKATLTVNFRGLVEKWNLEEGTIGVIPSDSASDSTTLSLDFPPVGSHLISIDPSKRPVPVKPLPQIKQQRVATLGPKWNYTRLDPNIITLDYCRYRIGNKRWSVKMPVWKVQKHIREHFGLRQVWDNSGVSFWKSEELGFNHVKKSEKVALKFSYRINVPETQMALMIETPEIFQIKVRNKTVFPKSHSIGWYIDPCFRTIDITGLSQKGENEITLTCMYRGEYEFESIYLIGDFGVYKKREGYVLDVESGTLKTGDWVAQGYPFFSGVIRYNAEVNLRKKPGKYILRFDGLEPVVTRVLINGALAGRIAWKPSEIDVTKLLRDGRNTVEIECVTSLRNTMGPHHLKGPELTDFVWAGSFCDDKKWQDAYSFVRNGITGDVALFRLWED